MASSLDLSSLADVKNWLNIGGDDDDDLIARIISQTSRAILSYLDRPSILPFSYIESFDGDGGGAVVLGQWPVIRIDTCTVNGRIIPPSSILSESVTSGYILDGCDAAPPGRPQRLSLRGLRFCSGTQNVGVAYTAGYQISGESTTVPFQQPYAIVARAPFGMWASDQGVVNGGGVALRSVNISPSPGEYTVTNGTYTFSPMDAGAAMIISYGYVPADLAVCCMDWASERYAYRSRIGQLSKSLGGQETLGFVVKDIPDYVGRVLQPYRRVVAS